MKYFYIITYLSFFALPLSVSCQDKSFEGDSLWFNYHNEKGFLDKLKLINFQTSEYDFAFRFWGRGQVIELFKDEGILSGELTNYIYHSNRKGKKAKTYIQKLSIDSLKVRKVYSVVQESGILDVPTDRDIDGWVQGFDGITYIIEYADESTLQYKHYWTPSSQDSLPEALMVSDFVKKVTDTLKLKERYQAFKDSLPKKGCYSIGIIQSCFSRNSFGIGYSGSTRLPLGFGSGFFLYDLGKMRIDLGAFVTYKFDGGRNQDLTLQLWRSGILTKESNDDLKYTYRRRKLDFVDFGTLNQSHEVRYGVYFPKRRLSIYGGMNYMSDEEERVGGILGFGKSFNKSGISIHGNALLFDYG
ncbi:MAG: hypothetical protein AAF740_04250 [Bacteroidota bacterium]